MMRVCMCVQCAQVEICEVYNECGLTSVMCDVCVCMMSAMCVVFDYMCDVCGVYKCIPASVPVYVPATTE